MTTPIRVITEKLPLGKCVKGDDIDIRYSHNGSWKSIGRGVLEKIKPLAKGGHQIKLNTGWSARKIQKHDIPAGVVVERRRVATEADGPEAGEILRRTAVIGGITYKVTHPATETATRSGSQDRLPEIPGPANDSIMTYMLVSAANMAGIQLEAIAMPTPESLTRVNEILENLPEGWVEGEVDKLHEDLPRLESRP